jgi:ketosteroid isomerase-like protein
MANGTPTSPTAIDEAELRTVIDQWLKAIRDEDRVGIRANHDPSILMFDVPPPFLSLGIDAYMATWDTFYAFQAKPVQFDLHDIAIAAGKDVAFATATGQCCDLSSGNKVDLRFRLTMGFRKRDGRWWIAHEHHSLPAAS